ncbi:MAG: deoxyribose-phosphate aldolase [Symbiobacteriaceae bacterium]|nr:deoxyribose-phosphate aldolase [Symbiobacteriaceae bacterium]
MSQASVASYIDHTLLKPEATPTAVRQLCAEAKEFGFASVCVNPWHLPLVAAELAGSQVAPCCVIGFPLGANATLTKVNEAVAAIAAGATELDMVINIGAAKEGDWRIVEDDITDVVKAATGKALVKVIIETCLLSDREKELACLVAQKAGATFVKTSTGFSTGGATVADVELMRRTVPQMKIKASGGIRDLASAQAMIAAGADRLGCSAGVAIVKQEQA